MLRIILVTLLLGTIRCASVSAVSPASEGTGAGASTAPNYGIGHRPIQEIQPPPNELSIGVAPVACYSLTDKLEAFGGAAVYTPRSEETRLDDRKDGTMRRFIVPESVSGSCKAPETVKVARLEAAIYWSPQTCAHLVRGPVLLAFEQHGANKGDLGYPITDELPMAQGGVHQYFESGEIAWTALRGVVVKRYK